MKEISIDDVIRFLIKNMISTKVKTDKRGTEVRFVSEITGELACTLYIAYGDNITVIKDVLVYLCEHPDTLREVQNRIKKYHESFDSNVLYGCTSTLSGILCSLDRMPEDIRKDLIEAAYKKDEEPHNANIDHIEFILTKLTRRDILEQLAEEASELADVGNYISDHANDLTKFAIKLIRATEDTNNVTPYSVEGINDKLKTNVHLIHINRTERLEEECGDINMCLDLLHHIDDGEPIEKFHTLDNPKWKRWAERLGFISF